MEFYCNFGKGDYCTTRDEGERRKRWWHSTVPQVLSRYHSRSFQCRAFAIDRSFVRGPLHRLQTKQREKQKLRVARRDCLSHLNDRSIHCPPRIESERRSSSVVKGGSTRRTQLGRLSFGVQAIKRQIFLN